MTEEMEIIFENLSYLFENHEFAKLKTLFSDLEPIDLASFMENNLEDKEKIVFFRLLPKEVASYVFVELDVDVKEDLIRAFSDTELKSVIEEMFLDDTVDVIEEMPANVVKRILKASDIENRKIINELLNYPEDSAGSIMTTEYVSLSENLTTEEAIEKIRKVGVDKETIYTCYITDDKKHLVGVTTVRKLLLADKGEKIRDIMDSNVITASTVDDKENVALKLSKYGFLALPVIDKEGCIVGIVTVDDAVDVIKEEAEEDIQKMAAIVPSEKPYLKQSIFSIWRSRVPWLILLLLASTFTSMVLAHYEEMLSLVLTAFVPMLMGAAGNAGGQTSVTIIRAIAVGEIKFKDSLKVLLRELLVSLIVGLAVAVVCFLKILLIDNLYNEINLQTNLVISSVCAISIVMAKIVGCILPLVAKQVKLDPAVVASPLMTTIVDVLSLVIYCSLAIAILG